MGLCQSSTEVGTEESPTGGSSRGSHHYKTTLRPLPRKITTNELANYKLRKRRPGCSGMFWRSDPTGVTQLSTNTDWPRDGAIIQGEAFVVNFGVQKQWLKAHKVKQVGQKWVNAPEGAFLPFEHDNHYYLEQAVG